MRQPSHIACKLLVAFIILVMLLVIGYVAAWWQWGQGGF